jgi:hypothetical protein
LLPAGATLAADCRSFYNNSAKNCTIVKDKLNTEVKDPPIGSFLVGGVSKLYDRKASLDKGAAIGQAWLKQLGLEL